jgi:hypothetical protein
MTQPHARLSKVARDILGYLERNPDAGDTLRGVARWWLLQQRIHTAVEDVQRALDQLVKLGLVSRRKTTPHGPLLYTAGRKIRRKRGKQNEPLNHERNKEYEASE